MQVFAKIVSPEISVNFEMLLKKILSVKSLNATLKAGPAKTLSRCIAKSSEYREEYFGGNKSKRFSGFGERFRKV